MGNESEGRGEPLCANCATRDAVLAKLDQELRCKRCQAPTSTINVMRWHRSMFLGREERRPPIAPTLPPPKPLLHVAKNLLRVAVLLLAGCGGMAPDDVTTPDAGPVPTTEWNHVANIAGPHTACEAGGVALIRLPSPDCAGIEAAAAGTTVLCPSGANAAVTCSEASGTPLVTLDCGPGCSATFPVDFR